MPKKALDTDYLTYLTMMVCYELGKTEEEVKEWSVDDLFRWLAFFRLKNKAEKKAMDKAQGRSGNSKVTTM